MRRERRGEMSDSRRKTNRWTRTRTSPLACRIIHHRIALIPVRSSCHSSFSSNSSASASYAARRLAYSTAGDAADDDDDDDDVFRPPARRPPPPPQRRTSASSSQCGHGRGVAPSIVPYPTAAPPTHAAAPQNAPRSVSTGRILETRGAN